MKYSKTHIDSFTAEVQNFSKDKNKKWNIWGKGRSYGHTKNL